MPMAAAAPISLSRTATSRRATPRSRHTRTMKTDSDQHRRGRTRRRLRSRGQVQPEQAGAGHQGGLRVGQAACTASCAISGRVQHGVASTVVCMKQGEAQRAHGQVRAPAPAGRAAPPRSPRARVDRAAQEQQDRQRQ